MNYYNENDPRAAAWLRELIKEDLIPDGFVDERSIADVRAADLVGYSQCHFFAGIGGWSLALELAGWPRDRGVWTGSCPCQPYSVAGKGKGDDDPRNLWPRFRRLVDDGEPAVVFGEQVASKAGRGWLDGVRVDLEGMGYAVGAADLCAAGVNAPHIRQRLYWVAYAASRGLAEQRGESESGRLRYTDQRCKISRLGNSDKQHAGRDSGAGAQAEGGAQLRAERDGSRPSSAVDGLGDADRPRLGEQCGAEPVQAQQLAAQLRGNPWDCFELLPCTDGKTRRIESGSFPLADGIPGRVGVLRGYGNAIVPQVAAQFIQACEEARGC